MTSNMTSKHRNVLGCTFSPMQARFLELDIEEAFREVLSWPISQIRLGGYWNELEPEPEKFVFDPLLSLLEEAEAAKKEVVLTVGAKAPRWPEFHFPDFVAPDPKLPETQDRICRFVEKLVKTTRSFSCITSWQIENEPFDPSGPKRLTIPQPLLQTEVELVRSLDTRQIVLSLWGNALVSKKQFLLLTELADVVGFDLYPKQFLASVLGKNLYKGPPASVQERMQFVREHEKAVWITELQSEPWEKDEAGYRSAHPESLSPEQFLQNVDWARSLAPDALFLWGVEYWLWQAKQGNTFFVDWIRSNG